MKKKKTQYLVTKISPCPLCNGTGETLHPAWQKYWETHNHYLDSAALDAWFIENNLDEHGAPPDEMLTCPRCVGYGEISTQVSLQDALRHLFPEQFK